MSSGAPLEVVDVATAHVPPTQTDLKNDTIFEKRESLSFAKGDLIGPNGEQYPTEQEWATLRRVYGKVDWMIYVIGVVEMCERFAYYGTTAVCRYPNIEALAPANISQLSTLSSENSQPKAHSRAPVLRARMGNQALWEWDKGPQPVLYSSISSSPT
jgi:hypothetical protein